MAICAANSYPFGFPSRSKRPPLDIIELLVTTLSNQDNKVTFVQVDEDGALEKYYKFINTCHDINIIVQSAGVYASSLNGESEIPNKSLSAITRALLGNSKKKK